jgi:hypothetical protein
MKTLAILLSSLIIVTTYAGGGSVGTTCDHIEHSTRTVELESSFIVTGFTVTKTKNCGHLVIFSFRNFDPVTSSNIISAQKSDGSLSFFEDSQNLSERKISFYLHSKDDILRMNFILKNKVSDHVFNFKTEVIKTLIDL